MKTVSGVWVVLLLATALGCDESSRHGGPSPRRAALTTAQTNDLLAFAEGQIAKTEQRLDVSEHPLYTGADYQGGAWVTGPTMDWRSPFLAGMEWLLYRALGDTANGWRQKADARTRTFDAEVRLFRTHDVGFKTLMTYGLGFAATKTEAYRGKIFEGANALSNRYLPQYGIIQSWDDIGALQVRVIIDTMMNVELFFLAAELTTSTADRDRWLNMGVNHAVNTEKNHIRDSASPTVDGSTYHVCYYERNVCGTHQGLADDSTWSRGQAWAMYGFTTSYRYLKKYPAYAAQAKLFLDTAQRTSNLYLRRLAESKHGDAVPLHDFDAAAGAPKDTSAAAVAASALVELSTVPQVSNEDRARYQAAAERMLDDLGAAAGAGHYREPPGALATARESILLRATTSFSDVGAGKVQVERGLVYADFYFLEALLRYRAAYDARPAPDAGTNDAGSTDAGTNDAATNDIRPPDAPVVDAPATDVVISVDTPGSETTDQGATERAADQPLPPDDRPTPPDDAATSPDQVANPPPDSSSETAGREVANPPAQQPEAGCACTAGDAPINVSFSSSLTVLIALGLVAFSRRARTR